MLTSNNQYIHADYLSPMPNALDAKNSPLALLAQTCSAIGSDAPNAKLVANIEKSAKAHASKNVASSIDSRDKSSPNSHSSSLSSSSGELMTAHQHIPHSHYLPTHPLHPQALHPQPPQAHSQPKSSFKPYESTFREQRTPSAITSPVDERGGGGGSTRIKTPKSSSTTSSHLLSQSARCESNQSASSHRASPSTSIGNTNNNTSSSSTNRKTPSMQDHSPSPNRSSSKESTTAHHSAPLAVSPSQGSPYYSSSKVSTENATRDSTAGYPKTSAPSISLASAIPPPYYSGYTTPGGLPYPMDLLTASALMSPHHAMLKAAAMNPYLNYARLKGGADPMMPGVCRDPYCTGCSLSPHGGAAGQRPPCPAGCTQCDHTSPKSFGGGHPHSMSAAAYAHAQLAALAAASQLPYVCNWIAGDTSYCGKRFGNSDELLQHLRTHTSTLNESMMSPASAAAAMAAAAAGIPPNHPLFQRSYPTPPLSPLSSAARYHPYGGKPGMMPTSTLGPPMSSAASAMPPMAHPSLAQYFSPYSLYGPRIGQSHP